ncbi:MAG: HemK/PrmC family methyltransferase [Candidatus Peregrinibacteria bacterium]
MKISDTFPDVIALSSMSSSPHLDREILLSHILQKPRSFCIAHPEYTLTGEEEIRYKALLQRRMSFESMDQILGEKEFFGIPFCVNESVLSPRPETEWIVEEFLRLLAEFDKEPRFSTVVDVGTGSGCILLSLAQSLQKTHPEVFSRMTFVGGDISEKALEVAKKNAEALHLLPFISFVLSDLLQNIPLLDPKKALLVANLPYIPEGDTLPPEVLLNDPHTALFSGETGVDHYLRLFSELPENIGGILFEFHPPQQNILKDSLLKRFPKANISFFSDFTGQMRFGKMIIDNL